jgi:hypothetical protein
MYPSETYQRCETGSRRFLPVLFFIISIFILISAAQASPADTVNVVARHAESNAKSIYKIEFRLATAISPKAILKVTFPDGFDLSELKIASSTTMNGGFDAEVNGQVLLLKRSGLGREIKPGEKVDVNFAIVKNPLKPADDYRIIVEIMEKETSILKQEKLHKILPERE